MEKKIEFIPHAEESMRKRGIKREEVIRTIYKGEWISAKLGRIECEMEFPYEAEWNGRYYSKKKVRPVFREESDKIVVLTAYAYYY